MTEENKGKYAQFCAKSKLERAQFLLTQTKTDCCFVFESTDSNQSVRRLYSYKWMLSAVSPVFETMFNGDFKESTASMDINIEDISFEDFEMFLKCIHRKTERASEWPQSFWYNLLYIVNKYMMPQILPELRKFVDHHSDPITIFKWNKMQNQNKHVIYKENILSDPRLGEFDGSTFIEFLASLEINFQGYWGILSLENLYKLIKSYIKQKGYDVNSQDMVKVCDGDLDEKGAISKSHREIIENLLYFADVEISTYLNDCKLTSE